MSEVEVKKLLNMHIALAAMRALIPQVEHRLRTIGLLDRIAELERRMSYDERCERDELRQRADDLLCRMKGSKALYDSDCAMIDTLAAMRYVEVDGEKPWLAAGEAETFRDAISSFRADGDAVQWAKLTELLDVYCTLTEGRPGETALSPEQALERLRAQSEEGWFDADVFSAFERSSAWKLIITGIAEDETGQ